MGLPCGNLHVLVVNYGLVVSMYMVVVLVILYYDKQPKMH